MITFQSVNQFEGLSQMKHSVRNSGGRAFEFGTNIGCLNIFGRIWFAWSVPGTSKQYRLLGHAAYFTAQVFRCLKLRPQLLQQNRRWFRRHCAVSNGLIALLGWRLFYDARNSSTPRFQLSLLWNQKKGRSSWFDLSGYFLHVRGIHNFTNINHSIK